MGTIYHLLDPDSGHPRYVGQTTKPVRTRYNEHLNSKNDKYRVVRWIRQLAEDGLRPELVVIADNVETQEELDALEIAEIARLRFEYGTEWIVNIADGGRVPAWTDEFKELHRRGLEAWIQRRREAGLYVAPSDATVAGSLTAWADPEKRAIRIESMRAAANRRYSNATPEQREAWRKSLEKGREAKSAAQIARYSDPEERRKTGEAISLSMTPEVRAKISASMRKHNYTETQCGICGTMYTPKRPHQQTCGDRQCRAAVTWAKRRASQGDSADEPKPRPAGGEPQS